MGTSRSWSSLKSGAYRHHLFRDSMAAHLYKGSTGFHGPNAFTKKLKRDITGQGSRLLEQMPKSR